MTYDREITLLIRWTGLFTVLHAAVLTILWWFFFEASMPQAPSGAMWTLFDPVSVWWSIACLPLAALIFTLGSYILTAVWVHSEDDRIRTGEWRNDRWVKKDRFPILEAIYAVSCMIALVVFFVGMVAGVATGSINISITFYAAALLIVIADGIFDVLLRRLFRLNPAQRIKAYMMAHDKK